MNLHQIVPLSEINDAARPTANPLYLDQTYLQWGKMEKPQKDHHRKNISTDLRVGSEVAITQQPTAHMASPFPFDLVFLNLIPVEEF